MRKRWKFLMIFFLIFYLGGCKKQEIRPPSVVKRVEIRCERGLEQICRSYVEEGQIRAVLDCLRLQHSKGTAPLDPERLVGNVFEIEIFMSDGQRHIYRHRGGAYLSRDSRPWQTVDPKYSEALYNLLWKFQ